MNLRSFSMALLVSALPMFASADGSIVQLERGDFVGEERITRDGETVVDFVLSKSGKAKVKKLNARPVAQDTNLK